MNFLRSLLSLFTGRPSGSSRILPIYVLSRRCNEPVAGQVDLFNELSAAEESDATYYTRKVLHTSGERRCFGQVEVELWFSQEKKLLRHQVAGGVWLSADEYAAELARFQAPVEEDNAEPPASSDDR